MKNNQILAVWGNPNSGKTITSIKIAKELSQRKKNVILVFCDLLSPTMITVLPNIKKDNKSLGSLLSAPSITQEDILSNSITLDKNKYISILGYGQGENVFTYAQYSRERVVDLLILLRHLADYVIVDCSSTFVSDPLSAVALEMADKVIRLKSASLKAISYFDSYLPLLSDRKFNVQDHIKVLSDAKEYEPVDVVKERYQGIKLTLPHCLKVQEQFNCGELFNELRSQEAEEYNEKLKEIIVVAFEEDVSGNLEDKLNTKSSLKQDEGVKGKSKIRGKLIGKKSMKESVEPKERKRLFPWVKGGKKAYEQ